ncbi:MAG TPA: Xaa-Pro peptidase family protein [Candidatus Methylomirabilis sp.]|nr:Xaa-Pro peptidase family protein [Candidatus Methylomirabilis sp.]
MVSFDVKKLNDLMGEAGVTLLLASTRHNVRYLTGGYYFHFHAQATRIGRSQYLPFVGLPRGRFEDAFYVGRADESGQIEAEGLWLPHRFNTVRGTVSAAEGAIAAIRQLGLAEGAIGVELPFLPADAFLALQQGLPRARFVDATPVLDGLRAVKTPAELAHLRTVYNRVAEAIQAAFAAGKPGITTADIARRVEGEMAQRGLTFLWAFTCAGPGTLRAPSSARWEPGRVLHIDAGGEEGDYLADICRMGCLGEPSPLARELHAACIEVQGKVRQVVRAGFPCRELLSEGERAVREHRFAPYGRFVAHGIGMVSHEQPDISPTNPRPLEAGMVLSIETEFVHPEVGHVKIEDAVAVTEAGCEGLGDLGRDWHVVPVYSPMPVPSGSQRWDEGYPAKDVKAGRQ